MKFMVTWQFHEGNLHETLAGFAKMEPGEEEEIMGDGVKLVGRWHDLIRGGGVAIFEAESAEAMAAYSLYWNRYMDLDIAPVVDDDEARKLGKEIIA